MALTDIPESELTDVQNTALRIREMIRENAASTRNTMEQINAMVNAHGIDKIKEELGADASDLDVWYAAARDSSISATKQYISDLSQKTSLSIKAPKL